MDQGDNQMPLLPIDFDINWSLFDNDWDFRDPHACGPNIHNTINQLFPGAGTSSLEVDSQEPQWWAIQSNSTNGIFTSAPPFVEPWGMNASLNCSNVLELSGLPGSSSGYLDKSFSYDVSISDISRQEQTSSTWGKSTECWGSSMAPPSSCGHTESTMLACPPVENQPNLLSPAAARSRDNRRSRGKPRVKCSHPGCNSTFPRKYELERHRSTVHDQDISIFCSVYGCNRIAKPFPRLDKFYEHVRKHHKGPERFLCIVESCRQGPLTRAELVEHLNTQHSLGTLKQPHLKDSLNTLNLGLRYQEGKNILLDNINACPLRFQGCEYSHAPSLSTRQQMEVHLEQHELLQRSKGYEMIIAQLGSWQPYGIAICPICREREGIVISSIVHHVDKHTKEERIKHAADLTQMFRPYLTGQEQTYEWSVARKVVKWNLDPEFRARVEESGILLAREEHRTPEDSELQPVNSTGVQTLHLLAE